MQLKFSYSFFEELREAINIVFHPGDYYNLRSVVWPFSLKFVAVAFSFNKHKRHLRRIWENVSSEAEKAFMKYGLRIPGKIMCYIHGLSCEGWFDVKKKSIHVRVTDVRSEKELLETILHELLHLATYKEEFSYEERERLVDDYLSLPEFKKLSSCLAVKSKRTVDWQNFKT